MRLKVRFNRAYKANRATLKRNVIPPLLILTLHHIHPQEDSLSISPALLEKALTCILDWGFSFVGYEEFIEAILHNKTIGKKRILLTFDDGYFDLYCFGFPVLQKLQIPAVCFLITDKITDFVRENYNLEPKTHKELEYSGDLEYFLNLNEILKMHQSGLLEFDSHTATHFSCNSNDTQRIKEELIKSRDKILEIFPNKKYLGFCFPKGLFVPHTLDLLQTCGYEFAFSTLDGGYYRGDNLFRIRRIDISQNRKGERDYLLRLRKKLMLYSLPVIGSLYSDFKNHKKLK